MQSNDPHDEWPTYEVISHSGWKREPWLESFKISLYDPIDETER